MFFAAIEPLAVADERTHKLTPFSTLPPTPARCVHPGVVRWLSLGRRDRRRRVIGPAHRALCAVRYGTRVRVSEAVDEQLRALAFLATAPSGGVAIYHAGNRYRFVRLRRHFEPAPVTRLFAGAEPGLVFADR